MESSDPISEHKQDEKLPRTAIRTTAAPTTSKFGCLLCDLIFETWNLTLTTRRNVTMHPFPTDRKMCVNWLREVKSVFMKIGDGAIKTPLCSLHFKADDFDDKRRLKPGVVPIVRKFGFYFDRTTMQQRKMTNCSLCQLLQNWKILLKSPTLVKLFPFPKDDDTWTKAIQKHHKHFQPSEKSKICSVHFLAQDFVNDRQLALKPTAIPVVLPFGFYHDEVYTSCKLLGKKTVSGARRYQTKTEPYPIKAALLTELNESRGDEETTDCSTSKMEDKPCIVIDWMKY